MSARTLRIRTERLQGLCATEEERVEAVASSGPASCSAPRWPLPAVKLGCPVGSEAVRARLIGEISRIVREPVVPPSTRAAALELIGWLARRFPGETPHALGVEEAVKARSPRSSRAAAAAAVRAAAAATVAAPVEEEAPITERQRSSASDPNAQSERRLAVSRRRTR
ncbi:hypothetical protein BH09MYX1_BH09MYX1_65140 [soil metagenome]